MIYWNEGYIPSFQQEPMSMRRFEKPTHVTGREYCDQSERGVLCECADDVRSDEVARSSQYRGNPRVESIVFVVIGYLCVKLVVKRENLFRSSFVLVVYLRPNSCSRRVCTYTTISLPFLLQRVQNSWIRETRDIRGRTIAFIRQSFTPLRVLIPAGFRVSRLNVVTNSRNVCVWYVRCVRSRLFFTATTRFSWGKRKRKRSEHSLQIR